MRRTTVFVTTLIVTVFTIRAAHSSDPELVKKFTAPFSIRHLDVSPDGTYAAAGFFRGKDRNWVAVWSLAESQHEKEPTRIRIAEPSYSLCYSSDSKWLAIGFDSGFSIIDSKSHETVVTGKCRDGSAIIHFLRGGNRIMVGTPALGLSVWKRVSDKQWVLRKQDSPELACTWSTITPNGKLAAMGYGEEFASKAGEVHILNQESGDAVTKIRSPHTAIRRLEFSPDSRLLAVLYDEFCATKATVVAVETGKVLWSVTKGKQSVERVSIASDLSLFAFGFYSGEIVLCEGGSGKVLCHWTAHSDAISGLMVVPNKQMIVSAGFDGTIKVWKTSGLKSPKE